MKRISHPHRACYVFLVATLSACATTGHTQPKLLGSVSSKTYTSPTGLFTVEVPVMTNPFVKSPLIADRSAKEPHTVEQVAFAVPDVGEAYLVGVRTIPSDILTNMANGELQKVLGPMADQTLMDWRLLPQAPTIFVDKFVTTPLGEGIVRVYLAPKGSLLTSAQGRSPTAADTFDTLIAVLVVKRNDQHLYAIAEFDGMMDGLTGLHAPTDDVKIANRLADQIVQVFGTMRLNR